MVPLHAILDVDAAARAGWEPLALAQRFLDGGARLVQLRAKRVPSGRLLELADALVHLADGAAAIVVNDRADVARMAGAAGVHVGQADLAPAAARDLVGPVAIVGYSTHTMEQVAAARREPVTYIAVGPVFGTATKDTGYAPVGLSLVTSAAQASGGLPVVAIGGITVASARSVIDAGAAAVAVISDLLAGDPAEQVTAFLAALGTQSRTSGI